MHRVGASVPNQRALSSQSGGRPPLDQAPSVPCRHYPCRGASSPDRWADRRQPDALAGPSRAWAAATDFCPDPQDRDYHRDVLRDAAELFCHSIPPVSSPPPIFFLDPNPRTPATIALCRATRDDSLNAPSPARTSYDAAPQGVRPAQIRHRDLRRVLPACNQSALPSIIASKPILAPRPESILSSDAPALVSSIPARS